MTTRDIVFAAIGVIASASAILAVTTRNLVHAALWLVVCLGTLAGCYVVLGAELVALVQVLVYVGAVVVLVLFALMLTRAPIGPQPRARSRGRSASLGAPSWPLALPALLAVSLLPAAGRRAAPSPKNGDTQERRRGAVRNVGAGRSSCCRCCCSWRWSPPSRSSRMPGRTDEQRPRGSA